MRKLTVKIAIILFAVLITIIAAISTLVFLINNGKLTHSIERWIKTNKDFDIKIKDIHLGIFSDLQLKQISIKGFSDQKQFTLGCNALTIHYKPFDLLKRRIKKIDVSDVQINLNTEKKDTIPSPPSADVEIPVFNIKDFYPVSLFIEDLSINNIKIQIATDDYVIASTEMNMQVQEVQNEKPFGISIKGDFSISNRQNDSPPKLSGEIDINTKYSLSDDELTILDSSYFLVNDLEKFSINGKAYSILSSPEINCNISCKSLSEAFKSLIPEDYKEWSFSGNISIDTTIDYADKSQKMTVITDVFLYKLKFTSPDYDYFGEGINGQIRINTNTDNGFKRFSFHTDGTFEPFLIQLGEFTTDMKNRKTHLSFDSNYDADKKLLSEIKGSLFWDNTGTITVTGDTLILTDNPHIDMNIEMKILSNAAFFETFVKDTIQYSNPALFNSRIDGESHARFNITGVKDAFAVDGHISTKELNFGYGKINTEGINIDLPISIAYPRSKTLIRKPDIPDSQYGTVQLKRLSYDPLEIKDIQINPIVISNNFFIKDPFKIPVFDGTIDLRNVSVENAINHDRKIRFEFQFNDINLENMTTTYNLTPFEGTLNSSIVSFQQQGQKLYSKDEIKIKLFGGDITISDLTLNNFLEPMTEIGFSAEVNHLDLGQMSNTYREWGNITGIINGRIKDFKLVAGEPSSFEIEMKTENYPDVKQTVSTKFLKNFVPGIGKVLDKVGLTNYKYAIMGLHARLENDYIKLQGAVREGGKELFMKGAGMKKLEIVFPNVDRRVPFKTFLNSFKGILGSDFEDTQIQFK